MKQRQSKTKIPIIAGTLPNNGALLNQHYKSQEELEAAARANTAALFANLKPDGWTASLKTTFHKSASFMDYLHGDVKDEEAWFACHYEYARESKDIWDAAKLRDDARTERNLNCEQAFWSVHYEFEHWIQGTGWLTDFFLCESFPHKDWNALSEVERKQILFLHETRKIPPLRMQILHYLHYPKEEFPEFNELAAQTKPVVKNVLPGEPQEPVKVTEAMTQKFGSVYHCLFAVDYSESPKLLLQRFVEWLKLPKSDALRKPRNERISKVGKLFRPKKIVRQWHTSSHWCLFEVDLSALIGDLTKQFKKWLASPENKKQLKRHYSNKRGKTGEWEDRLKDLAAWRLCREIGQQSKTWIYANEYACKHRKTKPVVVKKGELAQKIPMPFRDAKRTKNSPANQAPLFSDQSEASDAARNAWDLLVDLIPSEFKKPSSDSELMKWGEKLVKLCSKN